MLLSFLVIQHLISHSQTRLLQSTWIGAISSESLISFGVLKSLFFSFAYWLEHLPLQTTERATHLVHPESRHWSFVAQNGDMDDVHFKYYAWELAPCIPSTSGRKTTAIIMAMPPWTLTPTDLHCFATCKEASTQSLLDLRLAN
jgi:hypothetical protein